MADVIDYLFVFWGLLAGAVFIFNKVYESQIQSKKKINARHKRDTADPVGGTNSYYDNRHRDSYRGQQDPYSTSYNNYGLYNPNQSYSSQAYGQQYSNIYSHNGSSSMDPYSTSGYSSSYPINNYNNSSLNTTETHLGASAYIGDSTIASDPYTSRQYDHYNLSKANDSAIDPTGAATSAVTEGFIPTATGYNEDCVDWVNNILYMFYTQPQKYGSMIAESIYRSLNEKLSNITSSSTEFNDLIIEFNGINREQSSRPELANIRTECESEKSISATCKIYNERISFNLTIQKALLSYATSSHNETANSDLDQQVAYYELILEKLEGKLKCIAVLNDNENLIVVQFLEKPDTKILLKPAMHRIQTNLINEDALVQLILQTLTQVLVDLDFRNDIDFPQFKPHHQHQSAYTNYKSKLNNMIKGSSSEIKRRKHDILGALTSSNDAKERKVYVKIVRANNINYNQNVTCIIELDTPTQQKLTSTKQGSNPQWDEPYLFQITEKSAELSFELWDSINLNVADSTTSGLKRSGSKSKSNEANKLPNRADMLASAKFLGLAKVRVEELRRSPVQKISLKLQSNRKQTTELTGHSLNTDSMNDLVGGELQVELQYIEHASSRSHHSSAGSGNLRKSASSSSLSYQAGDTVSIERKLTSSGLMITKTTIIKPLGKQTLPRDTSRLNQPDQLSISRNQSPISSIGDHSDLGNVDGVSSTQVSTDIDQLQRRQSTGEQPHRSRSRSRSRSLLRAIKKRFSFSRTRSRSVGGDSTTGIGMSRGDSQSALDSRANMDSPSIDDSRSRASSEVFKAPDHGTGGRAKSVPASRNLNEVPTIVINKGRISDTGSAFMFTRPKSQLVYECLEPCLDENGHNTTTLGKKDKGIKRYYAVPDDPASKRKWRKRGIKLHLFNEHQFVACHLAGSSTCHLCGRVFSRRPGKQGYKCRKCDLLSHKECHVRVDHVCPYAAREGLKLEYIDADPPASLVEDALRQNLSEQPTAGQLQYTSTSATIDTSSSPMVHTYTIGRQGVGVDDG